MSRSDAATSGTMQSPSARPKNLGQPKVCNKHAVRRWEAQKELLEEVQQWLVEDVQNGDDIAPVYVVYKKMRKERYLGLDDTTDCWSDLSTLRGVDTEFLVNWLGRRSDIEPMDLMTS